MKREDVKNKIPGITEEQLNWLMQENGTDINQEKTAAEQYKTQLTSVQAQLKTAQDGLAAFEGKKKPEEYEAELAKLRGDMQAQAANFAFDNALDTAILGAKGRSVKAVRALLDLDALKGSKDRTTDINKDKAVNEIIDGFDAESVPGNLVADRLDSAGYSLALQIDSDGSAELTTAGTALEDTTALTEKTIYANIVDARTKQSVENVPTEGRWLLVSPETYGLLLKSPEFIKASDLGDAVVQSGAVGRIAGYTVFEDSTLGENVEYIAGHPNWFARVEEWQVPVHVQDLAGSGEYIGAVAVQGRKVYAHKVTKAKTILVKKKA